MVRRTLIFVVIFALLFPLSSTKAIDALHKYERITAHRGSSGNTPENTLSSVVQAINDGAGYAEIDVQLTSDGVIVLYHDETMKKHGIPRRITDMRYEELLTVDVGSAYNIQYAGERTPTLEQVMESAHKRIKLNIELKVYHQNNKLPEKVVELIEKYGFADQCIVTSFDEMAIKRVKLLNPSIRTGLIVKDKKQLTDAIWSGDMDILSIKSKLVSRKLAGKARSHNKELHVWTVNSAREMKRMLRYQVASIITDYPERLYPIVHFR